MEWQQLIYFQEVAKTEHIGKAAANLHVTQPTISISIKKLEDELGFPLFDRNKNSLNLNKYGKVYLKHVEAAMQELQMGCDQVLAIQKDEENRVTVMMPEKRITADITLRLIKEMPDLLFQNLSIDYTVCMQGLSDGILDFCMLANIPEYDFITQLPIEKQSMYIITSKDHHLADYDEMHLSQLSDEIFVSYSKNTVPRIHFEALCKQAGFVPKVPFECNYLKTMLGPVESGYAIALVSASAARSFAENGFHTIKITDDFVYVILSLCFRNDRPMRPMAEHVKDIFLEFYPVIEI